MRLDAASGPGVSSAIGLDSQREPRRSAQACHVSEHLVQRRVVADPGADVAPPDRPALVEDDHAGVRTVSRVMRCGRKPLAIERVYAAAPRGSANRQPSGCDAPT